VNRPPLVRPGKPQQFPLRIGQATFASDLSEPSRQLPVMCTAIPEPPVPIGRDVLLVGEPALAEFIVAPDVERHLHIPD